MSKREVLWTRLHSLQAVEADPVDKTIKVLARDRREQDFEIILPRHLLASLIASLLLGSKRIARKQEETRAPVQPLTLEGVHAFVLPDGRGGLELTIDSALQLPLVFPPEAIPLIRDALTTLEGMVTDVPRNRKH